jgi:hypothetical protein
MARGAGESFDRLAELLALTIEGEAP